MKTRSLILGALAIAFLGRVSGQFIVLKYSPAWLPPMEEWYSGLVPYPWLLSSQILILAIQGRIIWDLWKGNGFFARRHSVFGIWVRRFSYLYFGVMLLRYVITMVVYPDRRWFGGTIPIIFHFVLATFLFVWSRHHTQNTNPAS